MNMKRTALAACIALAALPLSAAIFSTNVWNSAAGGNWNVEDNWTCRLADGTSTTLSESLGKDVVWDFSALAAGAAVTNDWTGGNIIIAGMIFGENQGTVSLTTTTSKDVKFCKDPETRFEVGMGTTVEFRLKHSATVLWQDNDGNVHFSGPGTFQIYRSDFKVSRNFKLSNGIRLVLAEKPDSDLVGFYLVTFIFDDSASVLELGADIRVKALSNADGIKPENIVLNGHVLSVVDSGLGREKTYGGDFTAPGKVSFSGGNTVTLTGASTFSGMLEVENSDVRLGSAVSPLALSSSVSLAVEDSGRISFFGNQTVAGLSGTGTAGGASVSDGATLRIVPSGDSVFSAGISGGGGVVKAGGSDTRMLLDGANAYAGATTVEAGMLALGASPYPTNVPNLLAYYRFENPSDLGEDSSGHGVHLTGYNVKFAADGLAGGAVQFTKETGSYMTSDRQLGQNGLPTGNADISFSFWFRGLADGRNSNFGQLLMYGTPDVGKMFWIRFFGNSFGFTNGASFGDMTCDFSSTNPLDGEWHHVVLTYDGATRTKTAYLDGVFWNSQVMKKDGDGNVQPLVIGDTLTFTLGSASSYYFDGYMDEFRIYGCTLSSNDVKTLNASYRFAGRHPIPVPIAKWTFDGDAPLDDDGPGGYDLIKKSDAAPTQVERAGAYGKCLYLNGSVRLACEPFPSALPTGTNGPFSVSVRYCPLGNLDATIVRWGDSTAVGSFWAGVNNETIQEPKAYLHSGGPLILSDVYLSKNAPAEFCWMHMVYTWDPTNRTITAYRDGRLAGSRSYTAKPDPAAEDFTIGALADGSKPFKGYIDDLRLFDRTLTAEEVLSLARSLPTGEVPSSVASRSAMSVASGAKLRVGGVGGEIASLSGSGTFDVGAFAGVTLADAFEFAGPVTGFGALTLSGGANLAHADLSAFKGSIILPEGIDISTDNAAANLPVVSSAATVSIPASGTVSFECPLNMLTRKEFVLAEATAFDAPDSFAGWSISPSSQFCVPSFAVENGRFLLRMAYLRGTMMIFR